MILEHNKAFSLRGERALITGGGTGLGFAIAECMIAAGASVVLVGRRRDELGNACAMLGENAFFHVQDITKLDCAPKIMAAAARKAGGPISILVNNAGNYLKRPAVDTTNSEFEGVMKTHVYAAHALTRQVLPGMIQRRHGSIIFIASMASFLGVPEIIAYSAAKSAYLGMVRTLAAEVSAYHVRVNAIAPGWIRSAMTQKAFQRDVARRKKVISRTPMACLGAPEDIGWAAVYLCSKAAGFVTGSILPVDGGASTGF